VSLRWNCRFAKRSQFWGNRCLEPLLQNEPNFRRKALPEKQLSLPFWRGRSLRPLCLCGEIAVLQNEANFRESDARNLHCKTNPIFVGRRCWESSYLCHPGMVVLCVLCVSVVKLPFCKTKPISGRAMPGTSIAKRTQFLPEGLAKKAVIHCHPDVAVLCVLCVSVVELPFCKTKPICHN
jgi:hypothetical protein